MTVVLGNRNDLSLVNLHRVAIGGEAVKFSSQAEDAMNSARASFMAYLDSDRSRFIYGTTSGAGQRATQTVAPEDQREHARHMAKMPSGAGFGSEALPDRVVRMIIFARLSNYIEGHAKTRPIEAERIASMLQSPLPRVPLAGQVGAGEILPMFHIMGANQSVDVEEGEPMARINGSPVSAALVSDVAITARRRLDLATKVLALSVEAYGAPLAAYDAALIRYTHNPHEKRALKALRKWLAKASTAGRLTHQAPVSWRILPTVLAAAEEAVSTLEETADISLRSITDNPVYILPNRKDPQGRVISTGGYHNAQATPAIDTINARFADICTLCDRHTMKLHSAEHLPANLVRPGSQSWGTVLLSFVQVGYGEEARHAARRTFMPPSEGGGIGGQNDVASATMFAYQKHLKAASCLESALALLAASASQALWARDLEPAPRIREFLSIVREHVAPFEKRTGRDFGAELSSLKSMFSDTLI